MQRLVKLCGFGTSCILSTVFAAAPAWSQDSITYSLSDSEPSASDRDVSYYSDEYGFSDEFDKDSFSSDSEYYISSPTDSVTASPSALDSTGPVVLSGPASSMSPCACNATCNCAATKKKDDLAAAMKGAYKGVFYSNSFAYLNNPLYNGPYFLGDSFKGIGDGRFDFGGEYRSRYQHENNHRGLGLTGNDDEFWLTRLRMFANLRLTDNIRIFGEYLYADSAGENFAPRPIEENRGEAQNLFVDAKLTDNLTARFGRQELLLGAQRLVSPLDWANTRRTFDGGRVLYTGESWNVDGFYTNPVARVPATAGSMEWDSSINDVHFFGTYLTRKGLDLGQLEMYYIALHNDLTNFSFHTLGSRVVGSNDMFLYELEGGLQFGKNSNGSDHGAGFGTAGIGRQLNICNWKPTIWGWYDWASGSDLAPFAAGDNGFHHYFPLAHKYNGFMDLFGRRNLNDVNMQFIAPLSKKVNFLLWYHYFFLDKQTTPYSVVMTPFSAAPAGSKDLGHEIDLLFTVNMNARNSLVIGYSFFDSGDYYRTTAGVPTSADADFTYVQFQTRF